MVRRLHEVRATNDAAKVAELFTDDFVFQIPGVEGTHAIGCRVDGKTAAMPILEALATNWAWKRVEFHKILVEGDTAVAQYSLTVRHVPLGRDIEIEMLDLMEMRDGKIAKLIQHLDTAKVNAVLAAADALN